MVGPIDQTQGARHRQRCKAAARTWRASGSKLRNSAHGAIFGSYKRKSKKSRTGAKPKPRRQHLPTRKNATDGERRLLGRLTLADNRLRKQGP
jgi:hypothetical protein